MFVDDKRIGEAPPPDAIGQILLEAADYMEAHGHCKNTRYDPDGRVCLNGAIMAVRPPPPEWICGKWVWHEEGLRASLRVGAYLKTNPVEWNNAPERTGVEVIAALRAAARK